MAVTSSTTATNLARKWIAQKLIELSELQLVLKSVCDEVQLEQGHGTTANFVKVARAALPVSSLTEGTDPAESTFPAISNVAVVVEQWGAFFTLTDVVELTTSHPILQIAIERLADQAARLIDSQIGKVMLLGTTVRYCNGQANRAAITAADVMSETELHKLRSSLQANGAPPRSGMLYDLLVTPQVAADIMRSQANFGTWAGAKGRGEPGTMSALEEAQVGSLLGFNVIVSNFLPIVKFLGNNTEAGSIGSSTFGITGFTSAADASAGSLSGSGVYPIKVTRIDQLRGHEEEVTRGHTLSPGSSNTEIKFTCPASPAGYNYRVYAGADSASDADDTVMFLVGSETAAGGTITFSAVPTSGANPPATPPSDGTAVHQCFAVAKAALNLVTLQNLVTTLTPKEEAESNPLALRRKVGYKFMNKAGRRDETRLNRWEGAASY